MSEQTYGFDAGTETDETAYEAPLTGFADVDESETTPLTDEPADLSTPADGVAGEPGTTKRATRSAGVDKALVRRVAAKAIALTDADPMARALAAQVVGTPDEVVDLTVAIMTGDRSSQQVLADFKSLVDVSDVEAAIAFMGMPKPRAKAVWALLNSLGVAPKAMPGGDAKAAMSVVAALGKVGADQAELIESAADLLKKWA